jgi:hypothetical protein
MLFFGLNHPVHETEVRPNVRFWPTPAFQLENFKIPVRREVDGNSRPNPDLRVDMS